MDELDILSKNKVAMYPKNLPCLHKMICLLKEFKVNYSTDGNSTIYVGHMRLIDFLKTQMNEGNKNYVFHDILNDLDMYEIVCREVIFPKINKTIRVSRLFVGSKGTGTHFHIHSSAVNYLIDGHKLWFYFPKTEHNKQKMKELNMEYGSIKINTVDWFNLNYSTLKDSMEDFKVMEQKSGFSVYIPENYFHGVINLTNVFGITYSWY